MAEAKSPFGTDLIMVSGSGKQVAAGMGKRRRGGGVQECVQAVCSCAGKQGGHIKDIGSKAPLGQLLPLAGLGLTASAIVVTPARVIAAAGAWPARGTGSRKSRA